MNYLKITCSLFFSFLRKEKVMFLLISIGILICYLTLFIFTGFYFKEKEIERNINLKNSQVTLRFENFYSIDEISKEILEYPFVDTIIYSMPLKDQEYRTIACYYHEYKIEKSKIASGNLIYNDCETEFNVSKSFAQYYSDISGKILSVGSEIILNGVPLRCKGILYTDEFDILIPFSLLNTLSPKILDVNYIYKADTSIFDIEKLNSVLIDKFEPLYIIRPEQKQVYKYQDFLINVSNILLLLCIAIINYLFIYIFMLKKRLYTYSILKLCGMSNIQLYFSIIFEIAIIILVAYLAAYFIYIIGYYIIRNQLISYQIILHQSIYCFLTMLVLQMTIYIPVIIKLFNKSPYALYIESVVE